jgi:hypothetical protein
MTDELMIKILLSVCGTLLLVAVKLLMNLNNNVNAYGRTLEGQKEINKHVDAKLIEHHDEIKFIKQKINI